MNEFRIYFDLGLKHILDIQGIDHVLFVITFCAAYKLDEWRKLLILITAFTIGHSMTLALSGLNIITIDQSLVEFLIPVTILLTACNNLWSAGQHSMIRKYTIILFFGLIHGLGFSNFFKAIMMGQENILFPLLSFNIGVEVGQIIILCLFLVVLYLYSSLLKKRHYEWKLVLSGAGAGIAIVMIINKLFA